MSVIRRIDYEGDACINYMEFAEFMRTNFNKADELKYKTAPVYIQHAINPFVPEYAKTIPSPHHDDIKKK